MGTSYSGGESLVLDSVRGANEAFWYPIDLNQNTGPGVATRHPRRQKPRFLPPETKLVVRKKRPSRGDFFPIKKGVGL